MKFREKEYLQLGLSVRWLDQKHAKHACEYALQFSDNNRYGLNETAIIDIKRHITESGTVAAVWVR